MYLIGSRYQERFMRRSTSPWQCPFCFSDDPNDSWSQSSVIIAVHRRLVCDNRFVACGAATRRSIFLLHTRRPATMSLGNVALKVLCTSQPLAGFTWGNVGSISRVRTGAFYTRWTTKNKYLWYTFIHVSTFIIYEIVLHLVIYAVNLISVLKDCLC